MDYTIKSHLWDSEWRQESFFPRVQNGSIRIFLISSFRFIITHQERSAAAPGRGCPHHYHATHYSTTDIWPRPLHRWHRQWHGRAPPPHHSSWHRRWKIFAAGTAGAFCRALLIPRPGNDFPIVIPILLLSLVSYFRPKLQGRATRAVPTHVHRYRGVIDGLFVYPTSLSMSLTGPVHRSSLPPGQGRQYLCRNIKRCGRVICILVY